MKRTKRIVALFLMICMCLSMIPAADVKAAEQKDQYPTQVRITPGSIFEQYFFTVTGDDVDIKNVKSGSKDLIARWTKYTRGNQPNNAVIALYATKEGTYTFSFDIYKNGKKNVTKKVKVYAYELPLNISVGAENNRQILFDKNRKVSVTCSEKGTTIEKIEIGTYERKYNNSGDKTNYSSELIYKPFKNNSMVNYKDMGVFESYYKSDTDSGVYEVLDQHLFSTMMIRVTVKDKYTKQLQMHEFLYDIWH